MANPTTDKRTASQRIEDLERAVMSIYQSANGMAKDVLTLKEAAKLLGNKLNAVCQASLAGEPLNDSVLSRIMLENNIKALQGKVTTLVEQGFFVPTDTAGKSTFVVGFESDADGKVVNARLQFTVASLPEALHAEFEGKKVGDVLTFQEDKLRFTIQEVYNIVQPEAPATEEAPAAEQSSSDADKAQEAAPVAELTTPSAG